MMTHLMTLLACRKWAAMNGLQWNMPEPQEGFTLGEGQSRHNPDGSLLASGPQRDNSITPYQQAQLDMNQAELSALNAHRSRQLEMKQAEMNAEPEPDITNEGTLRREFIKANDDFSKVQRAYERNSGGGYIDRSGPNVPYFPVHENDGPWINGAGR